MSLIEFVAGYIPDPPDPRDYRFADLEPTLAVANVGDTFIIEYDRPARQQWSNGSCTGGAVARANEVLDPELPDLSGWSLWQAALQAHGTQGRNVGVPLRTTCAQMKRFGAASATLAPEHTSYKLRPTAAALIDARKHKGGAYYAIDPDDAHAINRAIRSGVPLVIGGDWDEHMQRAGVDAVLTAPQGLVLGGHAVCGVGVRGPVDRLQVLIDNSHGAGWANGGRAWCDWSWMRSRRSAFAVTRPVSREA